MEATVSLAVGMGLLHQMEARAMGGGLKGLSNGARLVLFVMCKTARDTASETEPGECYFRGWEHLALMLGYDVMDARAKRAVARTIAELVANGLIERDQFPGRDRRRATYRIHL